LTITDSRVIKLLRCNIRRTNNRCRAHFSRALICVCSSTSSITSFFHSIQLCWIQCHTPFHFMTVCSIPVHRAQKHWMKNKQYIIIYYRLLLGLEKNYLMHGPHLYFIIFVYLLEQSTDWNMLWHIRYWKLSLVLFPPCSIVCYRYGCGLYLDRLYCVNNRWSIGRKS
jgi:hypothetical protein